MEKTVVKKCSLPLVLLVILTGLYSVISSCSGGGWGGGSGDTVPPSIPTNLVATAISPSRINLSWGASTDNISRSVYYKIYRDGVFILRVFNTSCTIERLEPTKRYCFTVSACDSAGNDSGKSNLSCATTQPDMTPPTVPGNLSATVKNQTDIALVWFQSTDDGYVAGYRIFRDGALITTTADTGFTDIGLSTDTQYCYVVQAFDSSGKQSASSNKACATTSWKYPTIDSNVEVQWTSIAIDANDKLHIAYYDGQYIGTNQQAGTVNYATNLFGTWQSMVIDSVKPWVAASLSLVVNADGSLHTAYYYSPYNSLKHAVNTAGTWVINTIASQVFNVTTVKLAHDAAGNMHLAFNPNGIVTYMTNTAGTWTKSVLVNYGVIYVYNDACAIAVDTAGKAYVAYYDFPNHILNYVTNTSGLWITETVDSAADVGLHSAIAVDASGKSHISYYDVTNGDLKYATNATGTWVTQTIDSVGDVGLSTAIALDVNGRAHISYTDVTNRSLKYANNASGSWNTYVLDITYVDGLLSYHGGYTAIAIDSIGKIHISYRGDTHLRYATNR